MTDKIEFIITENRCLACGQKIDHKSDHKCPDIRFSKQAIVLNKGDDSERN